MAEPLEEDLITVFVVDVESYQLLDCAEVHKPSTLTLEVLREAVFESRLEVV